MKNASLKNTLKITGIFLLTILLATCDVGLGPSVDTTAPEITISSPSASAILKGTLNLSGTASDDGTISSVKVKLKGISSSNTKTYEYDATVDAASKTWSLSVDSLSGEGVKDGNYEITVTATDNSEKVSYRTTTFYVDNTAPVIMLDTPELKQSAMNYDVQLEGKIYDQSDVTEMTAVICSASGEVKKQKDVTVTNNSTWKVTFDGEDDLGLPNSPLLSDGGTYYYYVVAKDSVGNASQYFFHKPDVYTQFSGRKLDMGEWASFDKGDTATVSGQSLDRAWFNSIRIQNSSFSNPSSSAKAPSFSYSQRQSAGVKWSNIKGESSINKGDDIIGSITPPTGVDAPFDDTTFKCYIAPSISGSPFVIDPNAGITGIKKKVNDVIITEEATDSNKWPGNISISPMGSGRTFNISTELPEDHPMTLNGQSYYVYIEIQNAIHTKFFAEQAFNLNLSTPKLKITTESLARNLQTTTNDKENFKIEGTALISSEEHGCNLTYECLKDGDAFIPEGTAINVTDSTGYWYLPINNLEDGTYAYTFTAESSGLKTVQSRTLTIDTTNPTLEIMVISQDTNGRTVTVSGNANDGTGLASVKYRLTPFQTAWETPAPAYNWVYEINTSAADEVEQTFEMEVTDSAGNKTTRQSSIVIDKADPVFEITENAGWSSKDVKTMKGIASDTHFDKLTVTVGSAEPVEVTVNPTTHEWTWAPAADVADGVYSVVFEARDTAGKTKRVPTSFTRDKNGPVVEVVTLHDGDKTEKGGEVSLSISGTAEDEPAGIASIEWKINDGEYRAIANLSRSWTINTSGLDEGENTLYIRATDNSGNVTDHAPITFTTDYAPPVVWFGTRSVVDGDVVETQEVSDLNVHDSVTITGKLFDGANTSSIQSYSLSYTNSDGGSAVVSSTAGFSWDNTGSEPTYMWSWTLPKGVNGANDGRYTFTFTATDVAGKTVTKTRNVVLDTTGPVITGLLKNGQSYQSKQNEIGVSFNDLLSGVDKNRLYWRLGDDTGDEEGATRFTGETVTVDFGTEGVGKKLTFIAYDESGNRSYKTYDNITVDEGAPKLKTEAFNTLSSTYIKKGESFSLLKPDMTVATDGVAIKKLEVIAKKDGTAQNSTGRTDGKWYVYEVPDNTTITELSSSVLEIPAFSAVAPATGENYGANDGSWAVTVAAYDRNLQKSEAQFSFTIDATEPVIHINSPAGSYITGNTVDIRGSIDESAKGTGIDTVTLTISGKKTETGSNASETSTATVNGRDWTYTMKLRDYWEEGTVTVSAVAKDRAGNESSAVESSWKIDQNKPEISPITIKVDGSETSSAWLKGDFTASGTVTDTLGISKNNFSLSVKKDGTNITVVPTTTRVSDTEYTWSCDISAGTSGTYEIRVNATDLSGKTAEEVSRTVHIDKDAPVLKINNIGTNEILSSSSFIVRGEAKDKPDGTHAGVSKLQYRVYDKGTTPAAEAGWTDINIAENWTQTLSLGDGGIAEGNHTIEIRAEDAAENKATNITADFMVDLSAPEIEFDEGLTVPSYTNSDITLSGTVTDTNPLSTGASGAMKVTVEVNGTIQKGTDNNEINYYDKTAGTWSYTLPADTDGLKTVRIVATDAAGKTAEKTASTTVDKTAPTVTVTNPGTVDKRFDLNVTAYDMGKGVQKVEYSLDNGTSWTEMNHNAGSTYTSDITLDALGSEGSKTIKVKATDGLNEYITPENKEIVFYFDKDNPVLSVTPSTTESYTKDAYTLTISATDANLRDVVVTAKKGNETLHGTEGGESPWKTLAATGIAVNQVVTLAKNSGDGSYSFTVTATDNAGKTNLESATYSIILDTLAPVVGNATTASVTNEKYVSGSAINLSGALSENGSGVNTVKLNLIGKKNRVSATEEVNASFSNTEWTYRLPLGDWDEGNLTVTATATDKAGNSATSAAVTFVIDQNAPVIKESALGSGDEIWQKGSFTVAGTVEDSLGANTSGFSISVTKKVGDTESSVSVTPSMNAATDAGTNNNCTKYNWSAVVTVPDNESAVYTIKMNATDLSGKSAVEVKREVSIDMLKPELSFQNLNKVPAPDGATEPVSESVIDSDAYTIQIRATDDSSGVASVEYSLDGKTSTSTGITRSGSMWSLPILLGDEPGEEGEIKLKQGRHTIQISASDKAGNSATAISTTFIVDLENPTVTIDTVAESNKYIKAALSMTGTADDSNPLSVGASGSMTVIAYVNGTAVTEAGKAATYNKSTKKWSFSLPADTDGLKTVKIVAKDAAGKTSEATETITVDKTPPTVTVVNPGSISQDFTLTANAYDTGKGVVGVSYSLNGADYYAMSMSEGGSSWEKELATSDLGAEGQKTIYVKASDGLNESEPVVTSFYLDTADPVLTVTASTEKNYTNGNYTLTINAYDANLKDVKVTAKKGDTELTEADGWPKTFTAVGGRVTNKNAVLLVPAADSAEPHSADGAYTFNITATDNAGKTAFDTKSITIDTTKPVVTSGYAVPSTTDTQNSSFRFSGSASDGTNGSDVEKVEISFTNKDATADAIAAYATDASGQKSWSYTLVFADQTNVFKNVFANEGDKEVHVRATDVAGNVGDWVKTVFVYDKSAPTSSITKYQNVSGSPVSLTQNVDTSFETGKVFDLKGSTYDSYGIESVSVYQQIGSAEPLLISGTNMSGTVSWTLTGLPRKPDAAGETYSTGTGDAEKPVSGTYKYYAVARDKAGKETTSSVVTVKVDTDAPEDVAIEAPAEGMTGDKSLSGDSYTFRGHATDKTGGVGMAKILYAFVKTSTDDYDTAAEPSVTAWSELSVTDGPWSVSRTFADGTGSPASGTLNEGHWYFIIKAVDKAGNESVQKAVHFHVDRSSPVLTVTTADIKDKENSTLYYSSVTAEENDTFALAGTAEDSYGIKSVVISTKTGTADAVDSDNIMPQTGNSWSYNISVPHDTNVAVTITATDKSGKTLSKNYALYWDKTAPVVTINAPASGESLVENKKTLKGTAADAGSGIKSITYKVTKDGSANPVKQGTPELVGETWTVENVSLGTGQGTFHLIVTATDNLNNSTEASTTFYVDTANPTINETGIGSGGKTTKASFTLTGFVKDSNALAEKAVFISYDVNKVDGQGNPVTGSDGSIETVTKEIVLSLPTSEDTNEKIILVTGENYSQLGANPMMHIGSYKWTKTFDVGIENAKLSDGVTANPNYLTDGTYVFTITVRDVAGKTSFVQRNVKVDTTAPTFSPKTSGGSDYIDYTGTLSSEPDSTGIIWRKSSVVTLTVFAADEKAQESTDETGVSGLSTLEYAVYDKDNNAIEGKTGFLRNTEGNKWTTTIPLNDGENKIQITAKDAADNAKVCPTSPDGTATFESVYVDTQIPVVTIAAISDKPTKDAVTLTGTASDGTDGSGIKSVVATINGTPYTMDATPGKNGGDWSITFNTSKSNELGGKNKLDDGVYTVTVTATDNAGHDYSVSKSFVIDTEAPSFANPAFTVKNYPVIDGTTWFGSSSLEVTGTLTESNNLESISWKIDGSAADYSNFNRTQSGTSYTFKGTIPVSTSVRGMKVLLKAQDEAGNESTAELGGINVDLDAPTVTVKTPAETPLLNGKNNLLVEAEASDGTNGSGIDRVTLKIGSENFTDADTNYTTAKNSNGYYELTIDANTINSIAADQAKVYLQAKDKTGKTQVTSFVFKKDTKDPEVSITSPSTDDILNKSVTVRGTAGDDQELEYVKLYYSTEKDIPSYNETSDWTLLETFNGVDGYNWSKTIDTADTQFNVPANDGKYYIHFMVEAFDKAGNCDTNPVAGSDKSSRAYASCTIDQFEDCPVITFSNLTTDGRGLLRSTQTVYGSIEDDDGAIRELRVATNRNTTWSNDDSSVLTVKNGSWTYIDTESNDGSRVLYFRAVDAKNNTFTTPPLEETVGDGIFLLGTNETTKVMKPLAFRIDLNPPEIFREMFRIKAYPQDGYSGTGYDGSYAKADIFETVKNQLVLGGTNSKVDFFVTAADPMGIVAVSVKLGETEKSGSTTGETDSLGNAVWKISGMDVSGMADGTQSLVITVTDGSGSGDLPGFDQTLMHTVRVDNTAPTFEVTSHKKGNDANKNEEQVTGIVTLKGLTSDTISGIKSEAEGGMKYLIPTVAAVDGAPDKNTNPENWKTYWINQSGWTNMVQADGGNTWRILFDGNDGNPLLNDRAKTPYGTEYTDTQNNGTGIWKVPVYIRTEDKVGNVGIDDSFFFNVDPEGDKPKATVSYPSSGDTLGGTIRIFGNAQDNESVKAVYMQVDYDNDGDYDNTDKDAIIAMKTDSGETIYTVVDFAADEKNNNNQAWWGIKVTGTNNWNQTINAHGKFNPASGNTKTINVRFRAVDTNDLCGLWSSDVKIIVDKTAPRIGSTEPLQLKQFSDNANGTGNVVAQQDYRTDMWITGKWWLTGSVEDESGITSIVLAKPEADDECEYLTGSLETKPEYFTKKKFSSEDDYSFKIPLDTTELHENKTSLKFLITATDVGASPQTANQNISIKYDNTAPAFAGNLTHGTATIGDGSGNTVIVEQSNKNYSIEGTTTDGGSGFHRVAIYFRRSKNMTFDENDTDVRIYNPALLKAENRSDIAKTEASGSVYMSDGMPLYKVTGVHRGSEETLDFTSNEALKNIHKGGLVKIGGVYRLIENVVRDGTTNTITFTPSVSTSYTDAEFVYAIIIDNQKVETPQTGDDNVTVVSIANDDGDDVVESVEIQGGSAFWTVAIDSKQIPDGPIDICCVAIDKAGNISEIKHVLSSVQNNRPMIANVWLGSDYDLNTEISANEKTRVRSIIAKSDLGKDASAVTINDRTSDTIKNFKAVGKVMTIEPEIVGGNGELHFYYSKDGGAYTKLETTGTTAYVSTPAATANSELGQNTVKSVVTLNVTGQKQDATLDGMGNGSHKVELKIWDSTENLKGDSNTMSENTSQWASLSVDFKVNVVDAIPPKAAITPFYWKNSSNNSLYKNSTAFGHIELTSDLPEATFKDTNKANETAAAPSGEYDRDPKVSGIIKIQGTAEDETCLREIHVKVEGFTELTEHTKLSEFSGNGWTTTGTPIVDENGNVTGVELNDAGYGFFVTDTNGVTANGHKVSWELDLDTSKISGVAALDKLVSVLVKDSGDNDNRKRVDESGAIVDSALPEYRMDIVPYVTKVYTNLAKNKVTNWSVYNRTALGHYPVQSVVSNIDSSVKLKTTTSEDVTLYGFNVNHSTATITSGTNTYTVGNADETLKIDSSNSGQLSFNVANLQSGELDLTVNGLSVLNNKNNNDAKGSATETGTAYANWYNRQGNGDTNNILTDDVVFDVWEFNDRAAIPLNGLATGINMEINQNTGMLNYAFANGGLYFNMGGAVNGTDYSSYYWGLDWDTFAGSTVGFHVDELGYTYSVCAGGDTNTSGSVDNWAFWSSRWGLPQRSYANQNSSTLSNTNARRLEKIGLKTGDSNMSYSLMKYRFLSSEFASSVDKEKKTTNLYLVYYDALTNEIKFRAGQFSGTTCKDAGGFVDEYTQSTAQYYSHKNCQIIANGAEPVKQKITGNTTTTINPIYGRTSGQYVDVAVVKNADGKDVVCAVWYDSKENCLKFSYITDPITNWTNLKGDATADSWSDPQTIFAEGGEYCHIVADKNNHLHIAAYAGNGDVMYAYLDTYASTASSCTVDASGAVGEHLTLDVAINSKGHSIPYIGYYTSAIKMPKYAYVVDPTMNDESVTFTQVLAGTDENERFTGAWEVTVVPSPSRMTSNTEDKVNVAVWRDENGMIKNSKEGTSIYESKFNSNDSENWSKTYGNGTSNGILGYQISTSTGSCLETAQMR